MSYNIPLRVKLSEKEYDKVKEAKNKSKYVRNAINYYNSKQPREIELTKKQLLQEVMQEIEEEHDKFYEELLNNEDLKEDRIMKKLTKRCKKCDEELIRLARESSKYDDEPFDSFDSQSTEDKILSILPTLQGIYHSDIGITYERIREQAVNIGISAKELKDWIDSNPELINESDYLYRPPKYVSESYKRHTFEHDI